MSVAAAAGADLPVVRLDGELTIYRAAELKDVLVEALGCHPRLAIDLSGVAEIDTAGVQLLLLATRQARADERELSLVAPSPAVMQAVDLLDLGETLGLGAGVRRAPATGEHA